MASREAASYDQPQTKGKTEQKKEKTVLKEKQDIQIGGVDNPQETKEVSQREQGKQQLYEQMRQGISSEVIE